MAYARKNGSLIVYDAAYALYISDRNCPKSIFEIPGEPPGPISPNQSVRVMLLGAPGSVTGLLKSLTRGQPCIKVCKHRTSDTLQMRLSSHQTRHVSACTVLLQTEYQFKFTAVAALPLLVGLELAL